MNRYPLVAAAGLPGKPGETFDAEDSGPHEPSDPRPLPEGNPESDDGPGLAEDEAPDELRQDTPGRPKSASSRQQTQPSQRTQTGDADQDAKNAGKNKR